MTLWTRIWPTLYVQMTNPLDVKFTNLVRSNNNYRTVRSGSSECTYTTQRKPNYNQLLAFGFKARGILVQKCQGQAFILFLPMHEVHGNNNCSVIR
jgi:hypothetical protein